jgi:hypothetical protein
VHTLEIGGRELELFLTKHTLVVAAALASVDAVTIAAAGSGHLQQQQA